MNDGPIEGYDLIPMLRSGISSPDEFLVPVGFTTSY